MPGQVERWLETFMCKQYAETFEAYGFKTLQSLCQLQLPQLQIMGVAQEHCEHILDNVDILRQSLGGSSSMNHYQDNMYNAYSNRLSSIGHLQRSNPTMPMGNMRGNMTGYNSQGYMNSQSSVMQHQPQHQQTYVGHNSAYSLNQHSSYMGFGGTAEHRQYQFPATDRRGSNNYSANVGPSANPNGYHSRPQIQNMSNQQVPQTLMHSHMRHNSSNQNPQEVANNILQMAASTYMPNQTVTVPLSKSRSAPYHIPPKSPHNNYTMQGNCPTSTQQHQQHIGQAHQFAYPNSSPHQSSQGPCASPISPNAAYIHSPASHHSGQSMPNSSPQSVHSPTYGLSGPCVKSPCAMVASPGGEVCSPCQMASPVNCQGSAPNASPQHQQLRVNLTSGNHAMYQGQMTSPNHQANMNQYSPKTNPVTPPASHNVSPYSNSSRSSLHSPQHKNSMSVSTVSGHFFSDCASDIPETPHEKSNSNPLQSLQKLCMLPDHQVIDPKSVVNDACLESPQSYDHQKNLNSDADNHFENQDQVSASKTRSPANCDSVSKLGTEMAKTCDDICSVTLEHTSDISKKFISSTENEKRHHVIDEESCEKKFIYDSFNSVKGEAISEMTHSNEDNKQMEILNEEKTQQQKESRPCDDTQQYEESRQCDETEQNKDSQHYDEMQQNKESRQCDETQQNKESRQCDETQQNKDSQHCDETQQNKDSQHCDETQQNKDSQHCDDTQQHASQLCDDAKQHKDKQQNGKVLQEEVTKEIKDKENQLTSAAEEVSVNVKEISENGVLSYSSCGLVQCKTIISPETDGCEQVICKPMGCKENDDILSEILDYENVAKENNNELIPQLNGDENSCIQYYRPKCIKKINSTKKLHLDPSFKLHSKVLSNPLLVKTYSRRDQLAAKYRWRRSQMPRPRSLRGVPARLANAAQYSSVNYSDSDSDDGGVLLVREDIDFTQDPESPFPMYSVSDEVSQEGDVSSSIETEKDDVSLEGDQSSPPLPPLIEAEGPIETTESIDIDDFALDTTKNSRTLAVESDKNQAKVHGKSDQSGKKVNKSNLDKNVRRNSASSRIGHILPRQSARYGVTSSTSKSRKAKSRSPTRDAKKDSDEEKEDKSNEQNKSSSKTPAKRSIRKRKRASPMKYGDLYYSADYIIDSEEEIEVEKKSKLGRKENGGNKESMNNEESDVIILNDEEEESIVKKNESLSLAHNSNNKTGSTVTTLLPSVEGSKRTKLKANAKVTLNDMSGNELSCIMNKKTYLENEKAKNSKVSHSVDDEADVKTLISISDDDVENEVTETQESSAPNNKKKSKTRSVKKSGKGRLKKLQKSRAKFDMFDDETEEINLKKTISIMKKKHKKREKVKVDESKSRVTGPFLHVRNTEPSYCRVVNQYEEDPEVSEQKFTKKVSTPITVSTVHMSKLSAEKSVHVPSSALTEEINWVCQLCHKHSSFKFLGDLFGPYYSEGNLPSSGRRETSLNKDSNFKTIKHKNVTDLNISDSVQKTKKRVKSTSVSRPLEEVWVHEDCIAWADGVLLIGQKIYGLEEATSVASATMCSSCKEHGAMVGCLHKGCSQKFHYICAVESGCFMDEENFSLLCVKHKDKKMKQLETTSSKT
ncbi:uncharacterized protein PF3D7_1120600-like [Ostrea edulis]|uniref:uncharacterized protein PF3D7_1120600-like n=1 Tax=Ostrea edulis TaxID=37623 RepID=UPI0024AFCA94|nr:uncharacterized protein PF3D7_1120600-like [Ostrea edulis]XP_056018921.1 uncharacterized protein PF3D7_1120600-like [Ostrea edulis]